VSLRRPLLRTWTRDFPRGQCALPRGGSSVPQSVHGGRGRSWVTSAVLLLSLILEFPARLSESAALVNASPAWRAVEVSAPTWRTRCWWWLPLICLQLCLFRSVGTVLVLGRGAVSGDGRGWQSKLAPPAVTDSSGRGPEIAVRQNRVRRRAGVLPSRTAPGVGTR